MRFRFPLVKLDDRNGFCHEEDTSRMFDYQVDEFSTLEQFNFDPKAAAVLHLNWQVSFPAMTVFHMLHLARPYC